MTVYVTKVRGLRFMDGLIGGALAGVIHTVVLVIYGVVGGKSLWRLSNLLSNLIGQQPAPEAGFGAWTLVGMVLNIVILALLGGLFALAAKRLEGKALLWSALAFGVIAWAVGYFLVLPTFAPLLHAELSMLNALSALLVYGSVLGAYLLRHQRRELINRY